MKSSIFWGLMLCSPSKVNQRSGRTCCLHLQGQRISQARNEGEAACSVCYLLHAWLMALKMDVTCSSETSVNFQQTTWGYILEDRTLHNHHCENLKSYTPLNVCEGIWFQHDDILPHFSWQVHNLSNNHFSDIWINYGGLIIWCPCSPDLHTIDSFLWRFFLMRFKKNIYATEI
jgi:hypothetical protein